MKLRASRLCPFKNQLKVRQKPQWFIIPISLRSDMNYYLRKMKQAR